LSDYPGTFPGQYTVSPAHTLAGRTVAGTAEVGATAGDTAYDITVVGPNRFLRHFTGDVGAAGTSAQVAAEYYGPGLTVDTSRPFTVVTQFPAVNNKLTEIRRLYVQDGKVIQNAAVNYTGPPDINYIDDEYCTDTGATRFMDLGAVEGMGEALRRGMVLVFSIWWDAGGYMTWLDSGNAGPCNATEGSPSTIVKVQPNPAVTFSSIKWGEIGSTFSAD